MLGALALASGATALASYAKKRYDIANRKKFADSEYGQELSRYAKEGMYSPKARGLVTGSVARQTGATTEAAKSSYAGRLASQGLEGSVAGQRGMNEYDIARQREIADTRREIELKNEESKVKGRLTYAQKLLEDQRTEEQMKSEAIQDLIKGIGGIAIDYTSGLPLDGNEVFRAFQDGKLTQDQYDDIIDSMGKRGMLG